MQRTNNGDNDTLAGRPLAVPAVRRATIHDIPALLAMIEAYWKFERIANFDAARLGLLLKRLMSEPAIGAAWIALNGDIPLGYLLAVYVFSLENGGLTAEIDEFFVMPRGRRHGAGGDLLGAAEAEFHLRGCTSAALQLVSCPLASPRHYSMIPG
jgi:GNAT superfamily N-acetyltransferase